MLKIKHLADHFSRSLEIIAGDGCYLFDATGKRYIDFLAGWCVGNVGWKRKEIREALQKEAERGIYVPPIFRLKEWEKLAALLIKHAPGKKLSRVFRCTSGSEAVEFALKCARAASKKAIIVSIAGDYHGHTYGAASVGYACNAQMAPCLPGCIKIPMPNLYRAIAPSTVLEQFENIAKKGNVAAFLSEPVWTNPGSIIPPKDFYPKLQGICKKHGIIFIMDEVATGFGRCGKLFASELWNLEPDIMCLGKGFSGGYGTMGATLVSETIFEQSRGIPAYSTFGWLPTDLAATQANVELILGDQLWENASQIGKYLLKNLQSLEKCSFVGEVRGIGLLLGIEIVQNKKKKTPDRNRANKIVDECENAGLLLETAGNTLFITPPLILTQAIADEGIKIIKNVCQKNI